MSDYEEEPPIIAASKAPAQHPMWLYTTHFDDPTLSDLTIKLSDRSINVHRVILCRRSEYFAKLITGGFKESTATEIELHEDEPEAMMALFRFLYGLPYGPDIAEYYDGKAMLQHAKVYVVAEKYDMENLKILAHDNMKELLNYGGDKFDLCDAIEVIFDGTLENDTLVRKLLVDHCVEYLEDLRKQDGCDEWHDGKSLLPHFMTYITVDKYDMSNLKKATYDNLRSILENESGSSDYLDALSSIIENTPDSDTMARSLFVDNCVENIKAHRKWDEFMLMLNDLLDLGSAILGHENLGRSMYDVDEYSAWVCSSLSCPGEPSCGSCGHIYTRTTCATFRDMPVWTCPACDEEDTPYCSICDSEIAWENCDDHHRV